MKIATHIFGVLGFLGFLGAVSGAATSQSGAQGLSDLWKITDPVPSIQPSAKKVTFEYTIDSALEKENLGYKVFTDVECKQGEQTASAFDTPIAADNGLSFAGSFTSPKGTIVATLKPAGLSVGSSSYYTEDVINGQTRAKIQFCIRFSLFLPAGNVEVNFQESIIIIFVDLTDGFQVTGIDVAPKERLIRTSTQAYEVTAQLCTNTPTIDSVTGGALNQGSVVCVEVFPETAAQTAGLVMRRIDSFVFNADIGTSDSVSQDAITNAQAADLLTAFDPTACNGATTCTWSTILKAGFYQPLTSSEGASRAVTGDGVATMKFGTRRLGEDGRELQEEDGAGASEFDLNFDVNPAAPVDESSAATVAYGLVAALLGLSMVV